MPAHRTPVTLKLLNGSAYTNPGRLRDDRKITPPGRLEEPPPHIELTPAERKIFDWYVKHGALANVHRPTDAGLLAALARCEALLEQNRKKIVEFGPMMRNPATGSPKIAPMFHIERKLVAEQRGLLGDLGMSLAGRLQHAPPFDGRGGDSTSWDSIDIP
jgi:hypothetical protein